MRIRGHHLRTLQEMMENSGSSKNIGRKMPDGSRQYDPKVQNKLSEVYQKMHNADTEIEVTDSIDVICEVCPNKEGDRCKLYNKEHLAALDKQGADEYGLTFGKKYDSKKVIKLIRSAFV